jgi:hypothetical protein
MNERIKELAVQAGVTGYFADGTEYATPIPLSDEVQKFAELIVKECAELCLADYDADIILAHFGVEEN